MLIALAIAANLDNLGVGIAYGLKRTHISPVANALIALLSAGLTLMSMVFGQWMSQVLSIEAANILGAVVIITVGIWIYFEPILQRIGMAIQIWVWHRCLNALLNLCPNWAEAQQYLRQVAGPHQEASSRHRLASSLTDYSQFRKIGLQETLILGISLALNAMAGGFGASLSGYNAVTTALAIGIASYITIAIGQRVSKSYFSKSLGRLAQKIAGLLLILIGVYEIFF